MEELDISVIILTYNEEKHIRRCIENVHSFVKHIFVIDSYSTDKTLQIASEYEKVVILQNKWENNHAKQFNWGLENADISTKWVFRLDADEYLTDELIDELKIKLFSLPDGISAVSFPLRRMFLRRIMRRGTGKIILIRMFKFGKAKCEERWMDEHIQVIVGKIIQFDHEFADDNLNNLSWWTNKHVGYAIREAIDLLDIELDIFDKASMDKDKILEKSVSSKRMMKHRYVRLPLFWRAFLYFFYRYFIKGGFLDGKEGFLWHFLQGWWYRTLVDAKIFEIKKACGTDRLKIREYLRDVYNINRL